MRDPSDVAAIDQGSAASRDLGRMRASYYRGAVEGGAPRWLAATVTLIHAIAREISLTIEEVDEE